MSNSVHGLITLYTYSQAPPSHQTHEVFLDPGVLPTEREILNHEPRRGGRGRKRDMTEVVDVKDNEEITKHNGMNA